MHIQRSSLIVTISLALARQFPPICNIRGICSVSSTSIRRDGITLPHRKQKVRAASSEFASKLLQLQVPLFTAQQAPRCLWNFGDYSV